MPISIGEKLGSYEVTALLGKGGMGEVYRARDCKLDRDVAIKIMPHEFAQDPERSARFQREAQLLAALNHTHIAAIYDFQEYQGTWFLVLELIEGETLAKRLQRAALAVPEAMEFAVQIATGLEAAHSKNIQHRDLKPANIQVAPGGHLKILDFGLAKTFTPDDAPAVTSNSPTITTLQTAAGVLLGTVSYMSPEQVRGQNVDKLSDIWAFGCVLFEMFSGRKAFEGATVTDVMASIITREPDWTLLPAEVPATIRALLRHCLNKQARNRLHEIADARVALQDALLEPAGPPPLMGVRRRKRWAWLPLPIAALLSAVLSYFVFLNSHSIPPAKVIRFPIVLPPGQTFNRTLQTSVAISRDGQSIVYRATGGHYLRRLNEAESRQIAAGDVLSPAFSPDGQWVATCMGGNGGLKKIPLAGGAPVPLLEKSSCPAVLRWEGDRIIFAEGNSVLALPSTGGKPETWVRLGADEFAEDPQLLPDGDSVLLSVTKALDAGGWDKADIVAVSRRTGQRKVLQSRGSSPRYVPTGHLVYAQGTTLLAARFDVNRLEITGTPVPIVEGVMRSVGPTIRPFGIAQMGFSDDGTLAYLPSNAAGPAAAIRQLALADRTGKKMPIEIPPNTFDYPRLSPDGSQIAYQTADEGGTIWVYARSGDGAARRLTFEGVNTNPIWSPDSQWIAFQSVRGGVDGVFRQRADGTTPAERLTTAAPGQQHRPSSWWRDTIAFSILTPTDQGISTVTVTEPHRVESVVDLPGTAQTQPAFSPDGQWLAYVSNETGGFQVYVQPYPNGTKYQISTEGGVAPAWSQTGRELFYYENAGHLVSLPIRTKPSFSFSGAVRIPIDGMIQVRGPILSIMTQYDVTAAGTSFLVLLQPAQPSPRPSQQVNVVVNWFNELQQRVPLK